jgi:hypothetical protein
MDYSKSGNAKRDKNIPRDPKVAARGAPAPATGGRENKAALLARLKASAEAKKTPEAPSS